MNLAIQNIFSQLAARTAWRTPDGTVSYQDLEARVRRHAALLEAEGFQAGDFVAIRGCEALDLFALLLASLWKRLTLFPLPDRLQDTQQQLMLQQVPGLRVLNLTSGYRETAAQGPIDCDEKAPAVGIFTSGSTGAPKAIVHSWTSLVSSARATNNFYGFRPGDEWLLSLDPSHIGGLQICLRSFVGGGICSYQAEPKAVGSILQHESPAFVSLVPTQLYRLLRDDRALVNLRACRAVILGGAAASRELLEEAAQKGLRFSVSYGSSETAAQCTALPLGILPRHPGDVGSLLPGWDYESNGETLRLRGPAAALGYYQGGTWQSLRDAEGWLTLPDRILCDRGRLTVLGRADGIFQVAGENVSPLDIITPLEPLRHEADFIALPEDDAEYGTIPILVVRAAEQPVIGPILERLTRNLPGLQRPKRIYWHPSDEVTKPSRGYYEKALERGELPLLWRQDLGRI